MQNDHPLLKNRIIYFLITAFLAVGTAADDRRLDDPVCTDGIGESLECGLIKLGTSLPRAALDVNRNDLNHAIAGRRLGSRNRSRNKNLRRRNLHLRTNRFGSDERTYAALTKTALLHLLAGRRLAADRFLKERTFLFHLY